MSDNSLPRLFREGGWVAAGQALSALAALASIRILTELLSPEEFGRLTLYIGAAALALGLTSTPRLQAVIRFYPEWNQINRLWALRQSAANQLRRIITTSALTIALAGGVLSMFSDHAWHLGLLIAGLLTVDALQAYKLTFFTAARRQREAAILQTTNAWARPLMAIALAWVFGFNAEAAIAGYIAGSALTLLAANIFMQFEDSSTEHTPKTPRNPKGNEELKETSSAIKQYALPLTPLAIFGWLSGMGDRYIIAGVLTLQEVGIYAAAYGLASRPFLMLSAVIEQTLRPVLQHAIAKNDKKDIEIAKKQMVVTSIVVAAIGAITFTFFKDMVTIIFLAEDFYAGSSLIPWISLGYGLLCVASVYTRFCYAFDATRYVFLLTTFSSLIGLLILIPAALYCGLIGAAISVSARFLIELMLSQFFSKKAEVRHSKKTVRETSHEPN